MNPRRRPTSCLLPRLCIIASAMVLLLIVLNRVPGQLSLAMNDPSTSQEHPAIAYNSSADEYLVVWQDRTAGNWDIMGRRVRASDGALLGGELTIESPVRFVYLHK